MFFEINKSVLIALNSLTNYKIIEKLIFIFSDLPIFFIPIFLIYMWIKYSLEKKEKEKKYLLLIFYSIIIAIILTIIIQNIIHIDRPENYLEKSWKLILKHLPDASFPSDHASVSFSFLFALFFSNYKKVWYFIFPIFIIMILSRVIAWIHWPFDVIVWIFIGFIWSFFTFHFLKKIKLVKNTNLFIIKIMKYIKL